MIRIRIHDVRNFLSGVLFAAIGVLALIIALQYPMGTATRMGAGYLPVLLGAMMLVVGGLISVRSLEISTDPRKATKRTAELSGESVGLVQSLRPMFFVTVALIFFALALPYLGLILSVMGVVLIGSFGEPGLRWASAFVLSLVMAATAAIVFRFGIGLPFQLWP